MNINIRPAIKKDLKLIVEIYNQAVITKSSTADINPIKVKDRIKWFKDHNPKKHPIYVAEEEKKIVGWVSLSQYRKKREALRYSAEISYYIHHDYQGQGIGTKLVDFSIKQSKKLGIKNLIAIILEKNIRSIKLLKKFNFEQWGYLPKVADFDGVPCAHIYMGLNL